MQYTVRSVPPQVDEALRRIAAENRRSLNDVAREALAKGTGVQAEAAPYDDLDDFFGSWVEDAEVAQALAGQRVIDEELWR